VRAGVEHDRAVPWVLEERGDRLQGGDLAAERDALVLDQVGDVAVVEVDPDAVDGVGRTVRSRSPGRPRD
jgi:hypothetical protein